MPLDLGQNHVWNPNSREAREQIETTDFVEMDQGASIADNFRKALNQFHGGPTPRPRG